MSKDNFDDIVVDFKTSLNPNQLPDNHASFLLGAGFSVNQGYPTANQLNEKIQKINLNDFSINSDGSLIKLNSTKDDPNVFTPDARTKHFTKKLIELYLKKNKDFDYEEFYDFIVAPNLIKSEAFKKAATEFRKENNVDDEESHIEYRNKRLLSKSIKLFNQIIEILLIDKDGINFYAPNHLSKPLPRNYTGFLQFLEKLSQESITHIHTLNHDLFFETFNHSDWIKSQLSDGFDELGSKYYARIENNIMIRLSYFTNNYNTKFRLYKLHGSLDQFKFRSKNGLNIDYIKTKKGVNISNFYKEIKKSDNKLEYINDFTNYYADFLSGTTSKILRYNEDGYYKTVFSHFKKNLRKSNKLIIIGYGCKDSEINNMIIDNFNYKQKESFVIDPFPSKEVVKLTKKIGSQLIKQKPDKPLLDKINI